MANLPTRQSINPIIHQSTILLVDDSENDLLLMRAAFKRARCNSPLQEVRNGEEAIMRRLCDWIQISHFPPLNQAARK